MAHEYVGEGIDAVIAEDVESDGPRDGPQLPGLQQADDLCVLEGLQWGVVGINVGWAQHHRGCMVELCRLRLRLPLQGMAWSSGEGGGGLPRGHHHQCCIFYFLSYFRTFLLTTTVSTFFPPTFSLDLPEVFSAADK